MTKQYTIEKMGNGRIELFLDNFCSLRFSQCHNKIEVFDFDEDKDSIVFVKDFVNFVEAFEFAKERVEG